MSEHSKLARAAAWPQNDRMAAPYGQATVSAVTWVGFLPAGVRGDQDSRVGRQSEPARESSIRFRIPGVCDDGDERQQRAARRTSSSEVEEKAEVRRVERRGDVERREREHRRAARDYPYSHRPRRHPETTAEKRHQMSETA